MERQIGRKKFNYPRHRFSINLPANLFHEIVESCKFDGRDYTVLMREFLRLKIAVDRTRLRALAEGQSVEITVGNEPILPDILPSRYTESVPYHFNLVLPEDEFKEAKEIATAQGFKFSHYALRAFSFGLEVERKAKQQNIPDARFGLPVTVGNKSFLFIY